MATSIVCCGGLADLELGPFARNIMGGKEGAERISKALHRLNKRYHKLKSAPSNVD